MKILQGLRQTKGWNVTSERESRLRQLETKKMLVVTPYQENGPVMFRIQFEGRASTIVAELSGPEAEAFLLGVNCVQSSVARSMTAQS